MMLIMLFNILSGPSKGGYYVCCDWLASMVVFNKSGCTVMYLFMMFDLGSGVSLCGFHIGEAYSRGLCNLRNVPAELPERCVSGSKHSYALRMKLILYV